MFIHPISCALLGDMLAESGVKNGWAGIIVNGCIRDSADIAKCVRVCVRACVWAGGRAGVCVCGRRLEVAGLGSWQTYGGTHDPFRSTSPAAPLPPLPPPTTTYLPVPRPIPTSPPGWPWA